MVLWSIFETITYSIDIFCSHVSIFQWQIKLTSHRSQFWHLRRKMVVIFSKIDILKKFFDEFMTTLSCKMQVKKIISELFTIKNFDYRIVTFLPGQSLCWFLGKNLSNFVHPVWKLHNPYCHTVQNKNKIRTKKIKSSKAGTTALFSIGLDNKIGIELDNSTVSILVDNKKSARTGQWKIK